MNSLATATMTLQVSGLELADNQGRRSTIRIYHRADHDMDCSTTKWKEEGRNHQMVLVVAEGLRDNDSTVQGF